jgi:hypothetical protein
MSAQLSAPLRHIVADKTGYTITDKQAGLHSFKGTSPSAVHDFNNLAARSSAC